MHYAPETREGLACIVRGQQLELGGGFPGINLTAKLASAKSAMLQAYPQEVSRLAKARCGSVHQQSLQALPCGALATEADPFGTKGAQNNLLSSSRVVIDVLYMAV